MIGLENNALANTTEQTVRATRIKRLIVLTAVVYGLLLLIYLVLRWLFGDSFWWLAALHNLAFYYFLPLLVFIPLLLIIRARRVAVRLLPLLIVGIWLYGSYWIPKSVAGDPALKLVTFNIHADVLDLELIADWIKSTDAEVVLLQELGTANSAQLFAMLEDSYTYTIDLADTKQSALSRLPILQGDVIDLGDWKVDRLVLEVDDAPLAVYNIHMPVPYMGDGHIPGSLDEHDMVYVALNYNEGYRNTIIRNLLAIIGEEQHPYIVAGDFNTSDNSVIYSEMAALMRDALRETMLGLAPTWPANGVWPYPLVRLDYVWHSDDLQALSAQLGPRLGSDHLPLIVTFENSF